MELYYKMDRFADKLTNNKATSAAVLAYGTFVGLGFLKGVWSGWTQHSKWMETREETSIDSELYDPIVNVCVDTGYWAFYALQGGVGSALITGTCPVSIPLLTHFKGSNKESSDSGSSPDSDSSPDH